MKVRQGTKINRLLKIWPHGTVSLSSWLTKNGYSGQLVNEYKKGAWLETIGTGAWIRSGDRVDWLGALYALQDQAGMKIHAGAKTALTLVGDDQNRDPGNRQVLLFGQSRLKLPGWFRKHDWGERPIFHATSFLPPDLGLNELELHGFKVKISGRARAVMESLYLANEERALQESLALMELQAEMKPNDAQELLENCSSIRVKRLFLYLGEKLRHKWVNELDLARIELGTGKQSLFRNGAWVDKYKITVPKSFVATEPTR